MALPYLWPNSDVVFTSPSTALGTSPGTWTFVSPTRGRIQRTGATVSVGTVGGTGTIAVTVSAVGVGASTADVGALTVPQASNATTAPVNTEDYPSPKGATVYVNDGDQIIFTPAAGTGTGTGYMYCAIRTKG